MKVAIVSQPFDVVLPPYQNSIGYYTWSLAQELARSDEVTVFGLSDMNPNFAPDTNASVRLRLLPASKADMTIFRIRRKLGGIVQISSPISTSSRLFPHYGLHVASALSRDEYDIIHVQHVSQYIPIIRRLNPRACIVLHLHAEWFTQSHFPTLRERLKDVDLVLAVSDHIAKKTRRDFPEIEGRIATAPCAIDVHEFQREKDYSSARARRERRILYCGAISPHKGVHVLLDAFNLVAAAEPNAALEIVGSMSSYPLEETFDMQDRATLRRVAPYYAKNYLRRFGAAIGWTEKDSGTYQARIKTSINAKFANRVTFRGFLPRDEQVERYYQSDLFVFPPVWDEGFGIPPIEAMAAGLPVVGTKSGGLLETIKAGETGSLVDKDDPQALAREILLLIRDDTRRERMGRAARNHALSCFNWSRVAVSIRAHHIASLASSERSLGTKPSASAAMPGASHHRKVV